VRIEPIGPSGRRVRVESPEALRLADLLGGSALRE
jgi:hypothetical protein